MSGTRVYRIWKAMLSRCSNKNHARYADYGGRGIQVCQRWLEFSNFYADMGDPPEGASIDRKNSDRGYSKGNCRWATTKEQNNNQRRSLTINGMPLKEWAAANGVSYGTAYRKAKLKLEQP